MCLTDHADNSTLKIESVLRPYIFHGQYASMPRMADWGGSRRTEESYGSPVCGMLDRSGSWWVKADWGNVSVELGSLKCFSRGPLVSIIMYMHTFTVHGVPLNFIVK